MRLLEYNKAGELVLTSFPDRGKVPPYAILSHTWSDSEEVTFKELVNGTGKGKEGYNKIVLCGQQALRDKLQYFWVDTCCIDKSDKIELRTAINSMFRWYQKAAKCYVYLPDVSSLNQKAESRSSEADWESTFRKSRWFTRGWTLQELLAPSSVQFFSRDWRRLGDKTSLKSQIHGITGIPESVLEGASIFQFTVNERLLWKEGRQTSVEEDEAYALIGILGVNVTPIYGEGKQEAFRRVLDETRASENCIRDLHSTDPRDDKRRIQDTKGGLLEGSYRWVLENSEFQKWRNSDEERFLWVKGDSGKGKTMLLCGIIDELTRSLASTELLAYFFCQATDSRINNAVSILRGLLYVLVDRKPSLVAHIRKKYDRAGSDFFENSNAWLTLSEIFSDVMDDPSLDNTYLIIDALDECVQSDLSKLLDLIVRKSATASTVKVIVSSRNVPEVEEKLEEAESKTNLSLELNSESVSTAVQVFINHRVNKLAEEKKYDKKIQKAVLDHLSSNAQDTFLWVALACQHLAGVSKWNVIRKLNRFPPGLDSLYERMMQQISESDDADRCKEILALATSFYRPVTIDELGVLAEQLEDIEDDPESIRHILGHCGSFLILREDTIFFVHQSAQEFLSKQVSEGVLPLGKEGIHWNICSNSLQAMSKTLRRDMYSLRKPGYLAEEIKCPDPDPLAAIRYPCIYWVDHLCASKNTASIQDGGIVEVFLKTKFLYLLEALSIFRSMPEGGISMTKLRNFVSDGEENISLNELVYDAYRFILSHKTAIEQAPLQAYSSALLFSPTRSLIRRLFQKEESKWVETQPAITADWSACLQTIEVENFTGIVAFSSDLTRLVAATIKHVTLWDLRSGECLKRLHLDPQRKTSSMHDQAVLSSDSNWLATTENYTIKLWKIGSCWDSNNKPDVRVLEGHTRDIQSIAFSHDSGRLVSASRDHNVRIWNTNSGECLRTLFSHDSKIFASVSADARITLLDASSGRLIQELRERIRPRQLAFSQDSKLLASVTATGNWAVNVWDTTIIKSPATHDESHYNYISSLHFSPDLSQLASVSPDSFKLWDTRTMMRLRHLESASASFSGNLVFSYDSVQLATVSDDTRIELWNTRSGKHLQTLTGHDSIINSIAFTYDSARLASMDHHGTIKIWDTGSGECLRIFHGDGHGADAYSNSLAFSQQSDRLASACGPGSRIKVLNTINGECLFVHVLKDPYGADDQIWSIVFSNDYNSAQLASSTTCKTVIVWNANDGTCLHTVSLGSSYIFNSFDASTSLLGTNSGVFKMPPIGTHNTDPGKAGLELLQFKGVNIGVHRHRLIRWDDDWIKYDSENVVWLPPDFRGGYTTMVSQNYIAMNDGVGRIWIFKVQDPFQEISES
ncbi:hypothetical protein DM02DRAFT_591000 [Periconia macrospinosa]|uniref:NACHT domain-containing protein n=1 Tax=Periconia macrospinosa TaxID=97972 RepID=A0A2V1DTW7_9PLEO|nr:hypothetical protein DM02DRAFT_591000 [Periconia macrospinosa]